MKSDYFTDLKKSGIPVRLGRVLLALTAMNAATRPVAEAATYDPPEFDQVLVDRDALSLEARDAEELVTALTALASNFEEAAEVDNDVREKALAIALCLDPLDAGARAAHRALSSGEQPKEVEFFRSLTAISVALWRLGEKLAAREAEPEDHKLAPMVMELALLIYPGQPEAERMMAFQRAVEACPVSWSRSVKLQPEDHASNTRAIALLRPVAAPENAVNPAGIGNASPPSGNSPPPPPAPTTPSADSMPVSEVKRKSGSLTVIVRDDDSGEAVAGVAVLTVRAPTTDESSLFGLFTDVETRNSFEMRLTYDRNGATIAGIDLAEDLVRKKYARWPRQLIGEFSFRPDAGRTSPGQVNLALPAVALLASAFSGEALAAAFEAGGEYALAGGFGDSGELRLPGKLGAAAYARAAGAMAAPPKALFLATGGNASRAESSLLEEAESGNQAILFRPQVIGYDSIEEIRPVLEGRNPAALDEAIADFAEIQALTARMEMGVIARNEAVRERLSGVVQKWPGHLSARAMLAYGSRPLESGTTGTTGMTVAGSVKAVDNAMGPVFQRYRDFEAGESFPAGSADALTDTAMRALTALRQKIDPQAKGYLASAEKTIESAKLYLSLNNPGTSMGRQRHRELIQRFGEMNQQRIALGLGGLNQ